MFKLLLLLFLISSCDSERIVIVSCPGATPSQVTGLLLKETTSFYVIQELRSLIMYTASKDICTLEG